MFVTKGNRNFGIRATARTESSHAAVKSQLRNRNGHIHDLHVAIAEVCARQYDRLQLILNNERRGNLPSTQRPLFRELRGRVSFYALKEVLKNEAQAREALRDPRGNNFQCTESYHAQYGLPCWHDLFPVVRDGGFMPLRMIDVHWHLWRGPLPPDLETLYRIQDPRIIPRRQIGRAGEEHRRDRSHDELLAPRVAAVAPVPAQRPAQHRRIQRCSLCGQEGHRYNSVRCPRRGERR